MERGDAKRAPGRPRLLTDADIERLRALMKVHPELSLREIADFMDQHHGKKLCRMTWLRALSQAGLQKVRPAPGDSSQPPPAAAQTTRYRKVHRREPTLGRYPSSLTEHEWQALQPVLEVKDGRGRPVRHDRRMMWDAVFYLVRSGASWRMLPADFPSYKAVFAFFARARDSGLLERVYERLHTLWRERGLRDASPSAGIVDSQSVKTTEKGGSAGSTRARK